MNPVKNKPRKVLHIIQGFGTGGAETWLLQVAEYVQKHPEAGLVIDFLAAGGEAYRYDEAIKATGARIFYITYSMSKLTAFRKAFVDLLKREQYDAIHDHQDFASGWHFLLGIGHLPAVRISHLHNPYNFVRNYVIGPQRYFSFKAGRLMMALLTTKITGTSDAVMDEYGYNKWPYRKKRIAPLYCGLEIERFRFNAGAKASLCHELKWDLSSRICLFAGRIGLDMPGAINQKNPGFAFGIAKELTASYPSWKFIFAGVKGELGEQMEAESALPGDSIRFLGVRTDIDRLMSAADVLLFPSIWEGLGMVAVEAQAAGLQVLMSDTVPKEAIIAEDCVTVKSLSDGIENWAFTVNDIYEKRRSANRLSYNQVIASSVFSLENSVKKLISAYQ